MHVYEQLIMRDQYQQLPQVKMPKNNLCRNANRNTEKVSKLNALGSKGQPICSIYGMKPPIKLGSTKYKKKLTNTVTAASAGEQVLPDIKELNKILSQ